MQRLRAGDATAILAARQAGKKMSGIRSPALAAAKFTGSSVPSGAAAPPLGSDKLKCAWEDWQDERVWLLTDAMHRVAEMRRHGCTITYAASRISEKFNGLTLFGGKPLRASARTIQRYWYRWRFTRDPSVLKLKYRHVTPYQAALQRQLSAIWPNAKGGAA